IRNELTHGLMESKRINEEEVLYIGYCLLKLVLILKNLQQINKNDKSE
ncbi:hypothetical protein LCGC14_2598100, partial [marine sediment metagenome]